MLEYVRPLTGVGWSFIALCAEGNALGRVETSAPSSAEELGGQCGLGGEPCRRAIKRAGAAETHTRHHHVVLDKIIRYACTTS